MKRLIPLFILLSHFCLVQLLAQEPMDLEVMHLVSGKGSDFVLVSNNISTRISLSQSDLSSILINEGDTLFTEEGTFLEFLSQSGLIRIMVGENTGITFNTINTNQGSLFTLSQGHIHGLVEYSGSDLWISGSDTAGRISQGEFGFILTNSVTLNQAEARTRIYSIDGSLEVMQKKSNPDNEKRVDYNTPLTIDKGEMVITSSWNKDITLVPVSFDSDYSGYWRKHPFSNIAAIDLPANEPRAVPVEDPLITKISESAGEEGEPFSINDRVQIDSSGDKYKRLNETGTAALVLGTAFMTGATISYLMDNSGLGVGFAFMGGANLLIGASTLGYSYFTAGE